MSNRSAPTAQPITFCQEALFAGGYSRVSCELTFHLDGPAGTTTIGYSIIATDTGEQIELGVLGASSGLHLPVHLMDCLFQLHQRALKELLPF